jgi:hypothetical protein
MRAVLTQGGEVLGFSRRGRPLLRARLPFSTLDSTLLLEPTRDGGLVLAEGRRVVRLDATGSVVSDTRIDADVRALLPSVGPNGVASKTLIVGEGGRVFELAADGRCLPRSRFGGPVTAVARLGATRLLAVIDERRLVELDVLGDATWTRAESPDLELSKVFAVNQSGETRVLGGADFLVAYDENQQERFRVALSPPGVAAATGVDVSSEFLLDPSGATLVTRPGLGAIAIAPDGHVSRVECSSCTEPLRPAWLDDKSVVLACRSGVLLRLDGSPKSSAPAQ